MRPIKVKHTERERKKSTLKKGGKKEKEKRKRNIQNKYKFLMLKCSQKKKNNSKITKSIFHHLCPGLPVSLIFRLVR